MWDVVKFIAYQTEATTDPKKAKTEIFFGWLGIQNLTACKFYPLYKGCTSTNAFGHADFRKENIIGTKGKKQHKLMPAESLVRS